MATRPTRGEAVDLIHDLRGLLIRLNASSERMLLLEHILLRPRSDKPYGIKVPATFYLFRLSVILPAWTARCSDGKFRNLAQETVGLNCPAHVHPECLWLDYAAMAEFEGLHSAWLEVLRRPAAEAEEIDASSEPLIAFLIGHGAS